MLLMHWIDRALSRARLSAGSRIEIRIAMIPITTSNSTSVNASRDETCLRCLMTTSGGRELPCLTWGRLCLSYDSGPVVVKQFPANRTAGGDYGGQISRRYWKE